MVNTKKILKKKKKTWNQEATEAVRGEPEGNKRKRIKKTWSPQDAVNTVR